ncbi:hypothetical protein T01_9766 [Trichinella spiralis]|uniref:Uncharacterized protein n=1 Tax=Trichinella spiralis TaxID=6334 RepID=A0A0V1A8Y5_TRISP|nr:hypothetical protein T01_9766 [Trichinella spiralis]
MHCRRSGQRAYNNRYMMDWVWVVIDGRIPGVRIVEGVHNTGGGWSRRKVNQWEWILDGRAARIPL